MRRRDIEGRELCQLKDNLRKYPAAVRAILDASECVNRPPDPLSMKDLRRNLRNRP